MTRAWLIGVAGFLGLLLVVAIVVALLERESTFQEGSPEAVVQRLLRALEEDDYRGAYDLLSESLKEECAFGDFSTRAAEPFARLRYERVSLKASEVRGEDAFVTVRVTRFHEGDLFSSYESSHEERFVLRRFDHRWLFSAYPWPLLSCRSYGTRPPAPTRGVDPRRRLGSRKLMDRASLRGGI